MLPLPLSLVQPLREQIAAARGLYEQDRLHKRPGVMLPHALERKYLKAGSQWCWYWVFPADHESTDPQSGIVRRHHLYEQGDPAGHQAGGGRGQDHRAGVDPHLAPLVCHPSAGSGARHPDRAGAAGACRHQHHQYLPACGEPGRARRGLSHRSAQLSQCWLFERRFMKGPVPTLVKRTTAVRLNEVVPTFHTKPLNSNSILELENNFLSAFF